MFHELNKDKSNKSILLFSVFLPVIRIVHFLLEFLFRYLPINFLSVTIICQIQVPIIIVLIGLNQPFLLIS